MQAHFLYPYFFLSAFVFGFSLLVNAQNPDKNRTNHWFFGQQAGLDFSTGTAVADTNGKMTVLEGSATMSDTLGNLLFYTDGKTVWNAQHDTMKNGYGLGVGQFATPRQGALIVPLPGSNTVYYIFTVDGWENQFQNGLQYSIVDMTLDTGKGALTQKNILLFAPSTEQLAGVKDATGCGYWVVSHERYTDKFRAYHVTDAGIDTNAVISTIGADYGYMASLNIYAGGYGIYLSPNGTYAAVLDFWAWLSGTGIPDTLALFQFDKMTGTFSNRIPLEADTLLGAIGFSPDNTKLYQASGRYLYKLYQYDISTYSKIAIQSSKNFIYASNPNLPAGFQNGKNGKLYGTTETFYYAGAIQNPNASGLACNFVANDVYLGGRIALTQLPNFIQSYFDDSAAICITGIEEIESNSHKLFPNLVRDYLEIKENNFDKISLCDMTGRIVYQNSFKNIPQLLRIDVSSFARGLYIISAKTNYNYVSQKIILQ